MLPVLAAGLAAGAVSGGSGMLGGFFSNNANKKAALRAAQLSKEFAQHGVQWRVEDAKRAGLHPLAALGMMPSHVQPIAFPDSIGPAIGDMGQDISRAISASSSESDRDKAMLENRLLESQIGETDMRKLAIAQDIQNKNQPVNKQIGVMPETEGMIPGQAPIRGGVIDVKPSEVISASGSRPSTVAGLRPGEEQRMIGNMPIILPELGGESSEEIISEMNPLSWAALLKRNENIYGAGWLADFLKMRYLGIEPSTHYPSLVEQQSMGKAHMAGDAQQAIDRAIGKIKHFRENYQAPKWFRQFQRDLWMENQGRRPERR